MRPFRDDLTGKTDANGNATLKVKLPQTGEWHDLKVALGMAGGAEWALLLSGTAVNYGRGRRVVLGPELVQDGETLTVSVTGGPPNMSILGAVTGKSGAIQEVLASFVPQPNTIALDTTSPSLYATTITLDTATATKLVNVIPSPGTQAVLVDLLTIGFTNLVISGHVSGEVYFTQAIPGQGTFAALITDARDTSVDISVSHNLAAGQDVADVSFTAAATVALLASNSQVQIRGTASVDVANSRNRFLGVVSEQSYDAFGDSGEPAGGVVATVTIAAAGAGLRNVAAYVMGELVGAAGVAAGVTRLRLRDGASGAGTILRSWVMGVSGVGAGSYVELSGLAIPGTANTAMTLEFSGLFANAFESVGLGVYQRPA
jgi:hypothetical protein